MEGVVNKKISAQKDADWYVVILKYFQKIFAVFPEDFFFQFVGKGKLFKKLQSVFLVIPRGIGSEKNFVGIVVL